MALLPHAGVVMASVWTNVLLASVAALLIIIALSGIGDLINKLQDIWFTHHQDKKYMRLRLRNNINQLIYEMSYDTLPGERTDAMLRDALKASIEEYRKL